MIVGGGPTGLSAAILLKKTNHLTPVVYDAYLEATAVRGSIGLQPNGLRILKDLGLYDELIARGSSGTNVVLHSIKSSVMGEFDFVSWSKKQTGCGQLEIRRADLLEVLCGAAQRAGIEVYYNKTLSKITEGDQQVMATDFLLGYDGLRSTVRTSYVDPNIEPEYSGITDIFSLVPISDRPTPGGLGRQTHTTFTTDGFFALMCCTAQRDVNYWFFSSEFLTCASGVEGDHTVCDFKPIIRNAANNIKGEWGDVLRSFVDKSKELKFYPIWTLPLGGKWYKGRCLLLGDAAHAMSPHAGEGVSMALEDVRYDEKRSPRTDETSPWRLWFNEIVLTAFLTLYRIFNLQSFGFGQKLSVYNIREESL
ncbi:FAD binding domain protein [Cadophora sp. DSE1049]|nr:FAD binding domain protein [Cadophora sp. DSE1049]